MMLLKTRGSAFTKFARDEYTTVPERGDRPLRGKVVRTLLRGATAFRDGEIVPHQHFLTITEGREQLRELGRTMLWEDAQDVVFET
jgi:urate oxidase